MVFDVHVVLLVSYLVNITELVFFYYYYYLFIYLYVLKLWIKLCAPFSSYFIQKNIDTFSIYYIFFMYITFLISILKSVFFVCVSAGSVYFGN